MWAVVSIGLKEWMFCYTRAVAKRINSSALIAYAWCHRLDALASVGTFVGIRGIDVLHTRLFGTSIYVEIEISADGDMILWEGHEISRQMHDRIEEKFSLVKRCMVHVNPIEKGQVRNNENFAVFTSILLL